MIIKRILSDGTEQSNSPQADEHHQVPSSIKAGDPSEKVPTPVHAELS
jgi:hypothetical protein